MTALDPRAWTYAGCGGQMIGGVPADRRCRDRGTGRPAWPYDTETRALETVGWIYGAARASARRGVMAEKTGELLPAALAGAGVETGAYDDKIVAWLAGWEPQVAAVIAGLITHAHQSGREAGGR